MTSHVKKSSRSWGFSQTSAWAMALAPHSGYRLHLLMFQPWRAKHPAPKKTYRHEGLVHTCSVSTVYAVRRAFPLCMQCAERFNCVCRAFPLCTQCAEPKPETEHKLMVWEKPHDFLQAQIVHSSMEYNILWNLLTNFDPFLTRRNGAHLQLVQLLFSQLLVCCGYYDTTCHNLSYEQCSLACRQMPNVHSHSSYTQMSQGLI